MTLVSAPAELIDWAQDTFSMPVEDCRPHPAAGRSRLLWVLRINGSEVLLRVETGLGPFAGTEFTLEREGLLLQALSHSIIPVPKVYGIAPEGRAMLMEMLPGSASLNTHDAPDSEVLGRYCQLLARLHELETTRLPLQQPNSCPDHALLDLAMHERSYRLCTRNEAAEDVLNWLTQHAPRFTSGTSLVHGDAGPGNFLHHHGQITGLIDWEMAHVGDPIDDLAWLWFRICILRAGADDSIPQLRHAYQRYQAASGRDINPALLTYYCVAVLARCLIATLTRQRNNPLEPRESVDRMTRLVHATLKSCRHSGALPELINALGH